MICKIKIKNCFHSSKIYYFNFILFPKVKIQGQNQVQLLYNEWDLEAGPNACNNVIQHLYNFKLQIYNIMCHV